MKNKTNRNRSFLLLPIDTTTKRLAEQNYCISYRYIFIVNNYEITSWEGVYLQLWVKDPYQPYIRAESLLQEWGFGDILMFKDFFAPDGIYI